MLSFSSLHGLTILLLGITTSLAFNFTFLQTHDGEHPDSISGKQFLAAPFAQLCPSGNCIDDCHNPRRIFQAVPDNVTATIQSYGQPDNSGKVDVTVFGLCTNLVSANDLVKAEGSERVKLFFALGSHMDVVSDQFKQVALSIATCLSDTCGQTRDPSRCMGVCSTKSLLNDKTDAFDWRRAMLNCTQKLCKPSYVLPYANQDVLGIGVLLSYSIQGVLLLIAAAGVIASLAWKLWKGQGNKPKPRIIQKLKGPLATFLTAQTYFSISAAIAAFILSPSTIDPLNGYALMTVAIVGFLCPVFTLLLLRSHNARTGFGTSLTFLSWLLNTVIFFLLLRNLSAFRETVSEDALNQLFTVPTCGDSSAMSLCQQLTGSNPLQRLTGFFERSSWTNIRTVPILWAWTTFTLCVLIPEEAWQAIRLHRVKKAIAQQDMINTRLRKAPAQQSESRLDAKYLLLTKFVAVTVLIVLFSVSLGYIFHMVMRFRAFGVIDTHGWSFGQVVAAMFWAPVFLDVLHSVFVEEKHHVESSRSSQEGLEMKRMPFTNRSIYSPLPKSSLKDQENEEKRLHSSSTAPPSLGPRKRSVQKQQTLRMEEGQ